MVLSINARLGILAAAFVSEFAIAADYKAPATIIATLPAFCQSQYIDGLQGDPRYSIQGCGGYVNHYCPGLVQMAQAAKGGEKWERRENLRQAEKNMQYTLHWTEKYPDCMLRPLAQQKLVEIQKLRRRLNY